jgi:predicted RNA-binding Zn ribbon-like protein
MDGAELVLDFVNTRELLEQTDALSSPGSLVSWLSSNGLIEQGVEARESDLRSAVHLRESLRQVLLAHNGVVVDTGAAFRVLDEIAAGAHVELRFADETAKLAPMVAGVTAGLARIVVAVHDAMADGSWERLKACRAPDCEWAFIDQARNHSRAWCSMRSCGNREKARAFRERQRRTDSEETGPT